MSGKRKRVVLSMKQKLEGLKRLDNGDSLKKIAQDFGVGEATVDGWKKNRIQIENFCKMIKEGSLNNRATLKKPKNEYLDNALWIWYCQEKEKGVNITGTNLKEKALELNKESGESEFTASEGWLYRWRKRHGINQLNSYQKKDLIQLAQNEPFQESLEQNIVISSSDDDFPLMLFCKTAENIEESNSKVNCQYEVTHKEAEEAINVVLRYVEQQVSHTQTDIVLLNLWRDYAKKNVALSGNQAKITDYFYRR